jgi:hypothetical protein
VPQYDLNRDGNVNGTDVTLWLAEAGAANLPSQNSYLLGDANLDGTVAGQDFVEWNAHKFTATAAWCSGDFNADGLVDGQDFVIWNAHRLTSADTAGAAAVPEPLGLMGVGAIAGLLLRARRRILS